jgi:hypothetical protein
MEKAKSFADDIKLYYVINGHNDKIRLHETVTCQEISINQKIYI